MTDSQTFLQGYAAWQASDPVELDPDQLLAAAQDFVVAHPVTTGMVHNRQDVARAQNAIVKGLRDGDIDYSLGCDFLIVAFLSWSRADGANVLAYEYFDLCKKSADTYGFDWNASSDPGRDLYANILQYIDAVIAAK